jgi:hypothetical protein
MQTITKAVLAAGLFACVLVSAVQAMSAPSKSRVLCQTVNGTCVTVNCRGECGPVFPSRCTCIN